MAWAAAAGAAVQAAGDIASYVQNAKQAKEQRQWQYMMSSTAYRRAVHDLEEAGLNPILAAGMGGATTPPGAMAHADFGRAATSARQAYEAVVDARKKREEVKVLKASKTKLYQETSTARALAHLYQSQDARAQAETSKLQADEMVSRFEAVLRGLAVPAAQNARDVELMMGPEGRAIERGVQLIDKVNPLRGIFKGPFRSTPKKGPSRSNKK